MTEKNIGLKDLIENRTEINCTDDIITISFDVQGLSALFQNRTFKCKKLIFEDISNSEYNFKFDDCTFDCEVVFTNCNLDEISFKNTKLIKNLTLQGKDKNNKSTLKSFKFHYDKEYSEAEPKPKLSTNFFISNLIILNNLLIQNVEHIEGKFEFIENELGGKGIDLITFDNSKFYNAYFSDNKFKDKTIFNNTWFEYNSEYLKSSQTVYQHTEFYNNTFSKISFSNSNFIGKCDFDKCDFLSTTWFEKCKNLENSKLKFVACEFKGFSLFNDSKINFLDIDRCTFLKSSSFTDTEFNKMKLYEVKFGGGAYFDEMRINKVLDKSYLKDKSEILEWKRTLRAIKQELQKTENKIDFNTYRNYELSAHYEELNLFTNFKDTSILWATKWSSNFGNWFWSLSFTLLSGLFWYTILYRIENSGTFNCEKINEFFVGAFRFFLVTDFYNPLENDRTYLDNGWSWLIFILGKIFIAFGIYEMIQSFRKFKA